MVKHVNDPVNDEGGGWLLPIESTPPFFFCLNFDFLVPKQKTKLTLIYKNMTNSKDCIAEAGKTAGIAGGIGLFVSAMQNTAQKHTTGARGVITRTGGTIAFFGKN